MKYIVTSTLGMAPFSRPSTLPEAIADSVMARRQGLDGHILGEPLDASTLDCGDAAKLLGKDSDPASVDMNGPLNANAVAADMAQFL